MVASILLISNPASRIRLTASAKNHEVPYGVCELDKSGHLQTLNEKPQLDFLINIGLYVIKKKYY